MLIDYLTFNQATFLQQRDIMTFWKREKIHYRFQTVCINIGKELPDKILNFAISNVRMFWFEKKFFSIFQMQTLGNSFANNAFWSMCCFFVIAAKCWEISKVLHFHARKCIPSYGTFFFSCWNLDSFERGHSITLTTWHFFNRKNCPTLSVSSSLFSSLKPNFKFRRRNRRWWLHRSCRWCRHHRRHRLKRTT